MTADHAVQTAIRGRLVGTSAVTALVPAASILDRNARPAPDPSIIIGEGQSVDGGRIDRAVRRVFSDLHVWKREPGTAGVKQIAGSIRDALHSGRLALASPYQCGDCLVAGMRYLRDPDGETAHGIITVETLVSEA